MTSTSRTCSPAPSPGLLALAALFALLAADRIAGIAVALPRAALLLVAEAEARDVDLRDRDRDEVLALPADELALRDVLSQVLPDPPADDAAEARVVLVDLQDIDIERIPETDLRHGSPLAVTAAGVSLEDDIRFDATPSTGYVSFVLGFAVLGYRGGGNLFWH